MYKQYQDGGIVVRPGSDFERVVRVFLRKTTGLLKALKWRGTFIRRGEKARRKHLVGMARSRKHEAYKAKLKAVGARERRARPGEGPSPKV